MLKVSYTEMGLCLEYSPESLETVLSDRVCLYARAQRSLVIQPMRASIPLKTTGASVQRLAQFRELEIAPCDEQWVEITVQGLWITEAPDQEDGVFMTELVPQLEQRLQKLWEVSQKWMGAAAVADSTVR